MAVFSYRIILLLVLLSPLTGFSQAPEPKSFQLFSSELNTDKTIWVLLPEQASEEDSSYPVLYMHDAQNLFDAARSYAGEWEVDETMNKTNIPCIVVAIEHGNEKRIDELTPYTHEKYGGGKGKNYADFIVNTLKPKIDSLYPTLPEREHTLIGGSSLGGLISHYMLFSYPEVFSKAIIFSPSYWYSEKIYALTKASDLKKETHIYLASGAEEPGSTVPDHQRMVDTLEKLGFDEQHLKAVVREQAAHNEKFWKDEFPKAMEWLKAAYFDKK